MAPQPSTRIRTRKSFCSWRAHGEGEVGDEQVTVRPGVAVIIPAHTVHWFRNTGTTPMRQVVVLAAPDYDGPTGPATVVDDPRPLVCLDS